MKVKDIGEFGLIHRISKKSKDKDVIVGIGDDAAVIKTKGLQVLTTDCLVEGDHFRCGWFTAEQIGMKAIEINVSDVAAMGATPKHVLVSLALPHEVEVEFVEKMYKGMWQVCDKYKIEIIGGFKKVKKTYLEPKAKIDFALKVAPFVNSMIDISDGLAPEAKHICDESKCGAIRRVAGRTACRACRAARRPQEHRYGCRYNRPDRRRG